MIYWGTLSSAVVSGPTIPKVCGLIPSGGIVRIFASRLVQMWILVSHLGWKVMPCHSNGTLNQGLVCVACALSNTDFKDPDAHWRQQKERQLHTNTQHTRRKSPPKSNAKIGCTGQIPVTECQCIVSTPTLVYVKKKKKIWYIYLSLVFKSRVCLK